MKFFTVIRDRVFSGATLNLSHAGVYYASTEVNALGIAVSAELMGGTFGAFMTPSAKTITVISASVRNDGKEFFLTPEVDPGTVDQGPMVAVYFPEANLEYLTAGALMLLPRLFLLASGDEIKVDAKEGTRKISFDAQYVCINGEPQYMRLAFA